MGRMSPESAPPVGEPIANQPPSVKLVLRALFADPPATTDEIARQTWLGIRTIRWALRRLEDEGLVEVEILVGDARWRLYAPTPLAREAAPDPAPDAEDPEA